MGQRQKGLVSILVLSLALVVGCGKGSPPQNSAVAAPEKITTSLAIIKDNKKGKTYFAIQKASLEKEFLLQGYLVTEPQVGWTNDIRSHVVAFKYKDGSLILMEATKGHVVTSDLDPKLQLTSFPVIEEREDAIVFDFNAGMDRIFISGDMGGYESKKAEYDPPFMTLLIRQPYIQSAEFSPVHNFLVIRQMSQAAMGASQVSGLENNVPIVATYYLSPYQPDPTYTISHAEHGMKERVGFFTTEGTYNEAGIADSHPLRFHPKKPIVFAISSNTPKEYHDAIRDGILVWNKGLKTTQIQVIDAPAGLTAPVADYNMVQWLNYDTAEYAYAQVLPDPRTGKILHAHIYIPSVFAKTGRKAARDILNRPKPKIPFVGLKGFESERTCNLNYSEFALSNLRDMANLPVDEATSLRVSQDYIREVVQHEVGHTLGLRHNKAGSLSADGDYAAKRDRYFRTYAENRDKLSSDITVGSTVMDYYLLKDASLIGYLATKKDHLLPYDEKALEILYEDQKIEMPFFYCTDGNEATAKGNADKFFDCRDFDFGADPLEYASNSAEAMLQNLHFILFEQFVAMKNPESGEHQVALNQMPLSATDLAKETLAQRNSFLDSVTGSKGFLVVRQGKISSSLLDANEIKDQEFKYFVSQLKNHESKDLSGIEREFRMFSADDISKSRATFLSMLDQAKGKIFTDAEANTVKKAADFFYRRLPGEMAKLDESAWAGVSDDWKSFRNSIAPELLGLAHDRVLQYVMAIDGSVPPIQAKVTYTPKDAKEAFTATVTLATFAYPTEVRADAKRMLSPGGDEGASWGVKEKKNIAKSVRKYFKDAFGGKIDIEKISAPDVQVRDLSGNEDLELTAKVWDWLINNQKVASSLGSGD